MSNATIEQRLARVEELLSAVLLKLETPIYKNSTESLASLSEDPAAPGLFDPGLAIREKDREISRKRFAHEKFLPDNSLKGNWTDSVGMFGNDPVLKQIADEALRLREVDRQAARQDVAESESDPS